MSPEKRFLQKVYQEEDKQNVSLVHQVEHTDGGTMKSELDIDEYLLGSRQNSKGNIFIFFKLITTFRNARKLCV